MSNDKSEYLNITKAAAEAGVSRKSSIIALRFLAIQTNTDGRVCCWGLAKDRDRAIEIAKSLWPTHGGSGCGCYPGEERGPVEVHEIAEEVSHGS